MSDEKKIEEAANEYGNDTALPIIRSMYPSKSRGAMKEEFASAFKSGVKWRDENPSPIEQHFQDKEIRVATEESIKEREAELEELRKDKARLEWMIENRMFVSKRAMWFTRHFLKGYTQVKGQKTPREAIDAAMEQEKKA